MPAKRTQKNQVQLKARLDTLVASYDGVARRPFDPVGHVHAYEDGAAQELVGLLAASLAFGQITAVQRSITRVLERIGEEDPVHGAARGERTLRRRLDGFVHRVYRGDHIARVLHRATLLRRRHGSLGEAFVSLRGDADFREGLARFADALRGKDPDRGLRHLLPDPRAGSACKRLMLYLRWMVRPADGVDFGLWPVSPAELLIPVDTHILRIAQNLRLTDRKDASWKTAEDITRTLRTLDPADPVRYDFALCHLGVSRACPSQRDESKCAGCSLRTVCRHW